MWRRAKIIDIINELNTFAKFKFYNGTVQKYAKYAEKFEASSAVKLQTTQNDVKYHK